MRYLIVTEGVLSAESIRRALRYVPSCDVIGFADGRQACGAVIERERPDVAVVDLGSRPVALQRVQEVRVAVPATKIVVLMISVDAQGVQQVLAAGADAVIAKTRSAALGTLIHEVAAGNVYHSLSMTVADEREQVDAAAPLTARELEILRLVAGGMSNARVATTLFVTEQTVKFHLSNIYRKLGLTNRTQASHYAHVNGLLEADDAHRQRELMAAAA